MSLQEFLAQQTSGGKLESAGGFTLGLGEARDKLQRFRLPAPNFYLLKLVQAADSVGAKQIRFTIATHETLVTFTTDQANTLTQSSAILSGLSQPMALKDGPLRHLVLALGGALSFEPYELVWVIRSGHTGLSIRITKTEVVTEELHFELPIKEGKTRFTCYLGHEPSWKFWRGARRRAEAQLLIQERCRLAKLEVLVDHHPVYRPLTTRSDQSHRFFERYYMDPEGAFICGGPPKTSYTYEARGINYWNPTYWTKLSYYDPVESCCLMFEAIDVDGERHSVQRLPNPMVCRAAYGRVIKGGVGLLAPVKNSVLLNSTEVDLGVPGLVAYIPGQGMRLDLTDFQAIEDEVFQEALEKARQDIGGIEDLVAEHQHLNKPFRMWA